MGLDYLTRKLIRVSAQAVGCIGEGGLASEAFSDVVDIHRRGQTGKLVVKVFLDKCTAYGALL